MLNSRTILIGLLIILVGALIFCNCNKKKENYADVFYNKGLDSSIQTRPSFNSNLDPNNMNLRTDPYAYGGYIKGNAPNVNNLAASNMREGFAPLQTEAKRPNSNDFASIGNEGTAQATKMNASATAYKASLNNYNPNTLKYTVPQDLLPAPDMRQPLARDPSDPSNFMYDRTVFAPLKKRNHNEADRIRGDLDIAPVKTGWFDIATVPTVDLVKGYFGYYNDIQEYQDLQDIAYTRARNSGESAGTALENLTSSMNKEMLKPRLAYATQPKLETSPDNAWGQKRAFNL